MIDQALEEKPDAKWYFFMEADTYMNWNNLLEFLGNFDDSKPYYIGKHLFINEVEFAYGGAGFALSNPAMQRVASRRSERIKRERRSSTGSIGCCSWKIHRGHDRTTSHES